MKKENMEPLLYGSSILIAHESMYMFSRGFIDTDICLISDHSEIMGSVFRIIPHAVTRTQSDLRQNLSPQKVLNLQEVLEEEIQRNIQAYSAFKGEKVTINSTIQLEHVLSHKFLSVKSLENSALAKDTFKLTLEDFSSESSQFKIQSCYKYQEESNGVVRAGHQVYFASGEAYLNFFGREVNVSLEHKSKWELKLYSQVVNTGEICIMCGNYIWLNLLEQDSCLVATNNTLYYNQDVNDTNGLWKIEGENPFEGGFVLPERKYRLSQLSSGLYLGYSQATQSVLLSDEQTSETLWQFDILLARSSTRLLEHGDLCKLIHVDSKLALHGSDDSIDKTEPAMLSPDSEFPYIKVFRAPEYVIRETMLLLNCASTLMQYSDDVKISRNNFNDYKEFQKSCRHVKQCIGDMNKFIKNKLIGMTTASYRYGEVLVTRQKLLREQKLIDLFIQVLENSYIRHINLDDLAVHGMQTPRVYTVEEIQKAHQSNIIEVNKRIFKLLCTVVKDNPENQLYTFDYFYIFRKFVPLGIGASKCMTNIISENLGILSKLDDVIKDYVLLLKKHSNERQSDLLEFLSQTCTYNKEGITMNQERIQDNIFGNPDTFIKTVIPTAHFDNQHELYISLRKENKETYELLEDCFRNQELEFHVKEVRYFISMMELFTSMCRGRNYICKATLKDWFAVPSLIYNMSNRLLSLRARAVFCKMLLNLYIDSYPREYIKKPELIQRMGGISAKHDKLIVSFLHTFFSDDEIKIDTVNIIARRESTFVFNNSRSSNLMSAINDNLQVSQKEITLFNLKNYLLTFFSEFTFDSFTELSFELLELTIKMAKFQVFGPFCSDFDNKIIIINPENIRFEAFKMDIVVLLEKLMPILFIMTDTLELRYRLKDKITNKEQNPSYDNKIESEPMIRNMINLRNFLESYSRHEPKHENLETKCKLQIFKYIKYYLDCRLETLLDNIMQMFNIKGENLDISKDIETLIPSILIVPFEKSEIQEDLKAMKDCQFKQFCSLYIPNIDILKIDDVHIVPSLIRLFVKSSSHAVQSECIYLLLRLYSSREEFFRVIKRMHIITNAKEESLYTWARTHMNLFKHYAEQSDFWLKFWKFSDNFKTKRIERFNKVQEILKNFECFFRSDSELQDNKITGGENSVISSDRQKIMFYLGIHKLIIRLIRNGMHILKNARDPDTEKELTSFFTLCHKILYLLVHRNKRIQKILFAELKMFTQHLNVNVGQIELICEIFRNNYDLIMKIPESTLIGVVELIETKGRRPEYLSLFKTIQTINGQPIHEIQNFILSVFLKSTHRQVLFYMNDKDEFEFGRLSDRDCPVLYHKVLIKILAMSGQGSESLHLNKVKCQQIISFEYLIKLLYTIEETPALEELKPALLKFLYNIHLDNSHETEERSAFNDYIMFQTEVVQQKHPRDNWFGIWIKILKTYLQKYESNPAIVKYMTSIAQMQREIVKSIKIEEELCNNLNYLLNAFGFNINFDVNFIKMEKLLSTHESAPVLSQWEDFIQNFIYNNDSLKYIENEKRMLRIVVFKINELCDDITFKDFLRAMVNFIRVAISKELSTHCIVKSINFLGDLIEYPYKMKEQEVQLTLSKYGTCNVILSYMCDEKVSISLFKSLISFCVRILKDGNQEIQNQFYRYFVSDPSSEVFFKRLYREIQKHSVSLEMPAKHTQIPIYKSKDNFIENCLRFMQLLCENHNKKLQEYLRTQTKSRVSYDMVELTTRLLEDLLKTKQIMNYFEMSQCFETLSEFVQGPCYSNQDAIIHSSFLEACVELLSLDENSNEAIKYQGLQNIYANNPEFSSFNSVNNYKLIKGWMIAHLKLSCIVTLHSLMEGREDNYVHSKISRTVSIEILNENLLNIYINYYKIYRNMFEINHNEFYYYNDELFNHYAQNKEYHIGKENNPQDTDTTGKYSLIIEAGFLIYHMMRKLQDYTESKTIDLEQDLDEQSDSKLFGGFFSEIRSLGLGILNEVKNLKNIIRKRGNDYEEIDAIELKDAINFFEKRTRSIEVVLSNGSLYKYYFWVPPAYTCVTEEMIENFHQRVCRNSSKAKLSYLIDSSEDILEEIRHETWLLHFFNRSRIFAIIAFHVKLWRNLGFLMTLLINFIIITSYPNYSSGNSLPDPSLFEGFASGGVIDERATVNFIYILGVIQAVCSTIVTLFFLLKKGPILVRLILRDRGHKNKIMNGILVAYNVLKNFDVLFHLLYMSFAILGLVVSPFFFVMHLTEIFYRYPSLQAVLQSIVIPWRLLLLTFVWMLTIIYMFSLIGYAGFNSHFQHGCKSLLNCVSVVITQGFKHDGGIGGYMEGFPSGDEYIYRLFYDNFYNIFVMIIMLNIIQGIIIDTFAYLRDQDEQNNKDKENKCFICGIDKKDIERESNCFFQEHRKIEHNEWNYILFLAYLKSKKETEHTGLESDVYANILRKEISWFPINRALSLKSTYLEEEAISDSIKKIQDNLNKLVKDFKTNIIS